MRRISFEDQSHDIIIITLYHIVSARMQRECLSHKCCSFGLVDAVTCGCFGVNFFNKLLFVSLTPVLCLRLRLNAASRVDRRKNLRLRLKLRRRRRLRNEQQLFSLKLTPTPADAFSRQPNEHDYSSICKLNIVKTVYSNAQRTIIIELISYQLSLTVKKN